MNERIKEIIWAIFTGAIVIAIIIIVCIVVLNQLSPFNQCENKSDDYIVKFGQKYFTCAELRAVNTTE